MIGIKTINIKHLNVNINSSELVGVIGTNGCGKTILLKIKCT